MNIAVIVFVGLDHRIDYLLRSLCRGSIVEINEWAPFSQHGLQYGEILSNSRYVEWRCRLWLSCDKRGWQQRLGGFARPAISAVLALACAGFQRDQLQLLVL